MVRLHDGGERIDVAELGSTYRRWIEGRGESGTLQRKRGRGQVVASACCSSGLTGPGMAWSLKYYPNSLRWAWIRSFC